MAKITNNKPKLTKDCLKRVWRPACNGARTVMLCCVPRAAAALADITDKLFADPLNNRRGGFFYFGGPF